MPASYLKDIDLPDPALAPLDQVFRIEIANRMRNYHLSRIDKICMDNAIEVRCPFLDIHVLESGLKLSAKTKRPNEVPKGFLSSSFADILPAWLVSRKKQPFTLPIGQWLSGPLSQYAGDVLNDPNSFIKGIVDPQPYLEQLSGPGAAHAAAKLWALLQLEAWHQVFKSKL
jgi:asparagine synthase (glutamine-hydrolysing)